jgi:hypothetical protein
MIHASSGACVVLESLCFVEAAVSNPVVRRLRIAAEALADVERRELLQVFSSLQTPRLEALAWLSTKAAPRRKRSLSLQTRRLEA